MNNVGVALGEIMHNAIVKTYPSGRVTVLCSEGKIFRERGWELSDNSIKSESAFVDECVCSDGGIRARRRAKSAVRDLALSNDFDMFVTFTLDAAQVNRYDVAAVTRKLNTWLDNRVRRDGLKYVLVPEHHSDGAIHFHGLINSAALSPVDSGTITIGGKPRKPRSKGQRNEWIENGGHIVYNLPKWTLGFSTGIYLYGDYDSAVSYVCKYINKTADRVGGRWYYHGGDLAHPSVMCVDLDFDVLAAEYPAGAWCSSGGTKFIAFNVGDVQHGDI